MDNLPHAFTAIACAHAMSRERPSGLTLTAAVLAANVQDLDWLPVPSLRPESVEPHRGTMHSLLAMPVLAIGAALGSRFVAMKRVGVPCPAPCRFSPWTGNRHQTVSRLGLILALVVRATPPAAPPVRWAALYLILVSLYLLPGVLYLLSEVGGRLVAFRLPSVMATQTLLGGLVWAQWRRR